MRAAALSNGLVLYCGDRPREAGERLHLGALLFRLGLGVIIGVLLGSLGVEVDIETSDRTIRFQLAAYIFFSIAGLYSNRANGY